MGDTGVVPLAVLSALFLMSAVQHLLIRMRDQGARDHFWFGIAALAMAGAAAAGVLPRPSGPATATAAGHLLATLCALAWLVATAWFTVEYAGGDRRRRQAAILLVTLLMVAWAGELALTAIGRESSDPATAGGVLQVLAMIALALLFWLVGDGALRMWQLRLRFGAAVLGGIGIVLAIVATQHPWSNPGPIALQPTSFYAFLVVIVAMAYALAGGIAHAKVLAHRQHQELAHASRLSIVGELTASIAHEINQPLSAILSNADAGEILLGHPDPPLDEINKILADIRRDGLRASGVIRHVRTLVRKRELALAKLDANAVASGVAALVEPESRLRRILVTTELLPSAAWFQGDRALIEQALINLLLNAMDSVQALGALEADNAASARSPIVLGVATTSHGEIEFLVADHGQGIPTEHMEHLFTSFHTSKPHGMGLGLSIARSIVETHGGRITAENNPAGGATFRVTLPPCD